MQCAVNPHAFAEDYYPVNPGNPNKRVLVVGSGPAGIMAAITAAERGMQVELWEKRNELGGLLLAPGGPRFKKDGVQETIEADTVAIAAGYRSNSSLYEAINGKVDCAIVGDAEVPDNILKAVHHVFNSVCCI